MLWIVEDGAPGRTRTCNLRLRRPLLYPVELQAHRWIAKQSLICKRIKVVKLTVKQVKKMVGVERFELPTSCTQSRRATRLRYTPTY